MFGLYILFSSPFVLSGDTKATAIQKAAFKGLLFIISPAIPAVLLSQIGQTKRKFGRRVAEAQQLTGSSRHIAELADCVHTDDAARRLCTTFKTIEVSTEVIYQAVIQLTILGLIRTSTPTEYGVTGLFAEEGVDFIPWIPDEFFFWVSVVLGLRSAIATHYRLTPAAGRFSAGPKVLVVTSALLFIATKIVAMVTFFAPILGLGHLLAHWQREQQLFLPSREAVTSFLSGQFNSTFPLFTYLATNGSVLDLAWSRLERGQSPAQRPHYSLYTGLAMRHWFLVFFLVSLVHLLLTLACKYALSPAFRRQLRDNPTDAWVHVLANKNLLLPSTTWDRAGEPGADWSTACFKARWRQILQDRVEWYSTFWRFSKTGIMLTTRYTFRISIPENRRFLPHIFKYCNHRNI